MKIENKLRLDARRVREEEGAVKLMQGGEGAGEGDLLASLCSSPSREASPTALPHPSRAS